MSLLTDLIFVKALRSNETLMEQLAAGDVYNTTIAVPDEDMDNAELPYIIVTFDGLNVDTYTKDSSFEGENDRVSIGIEVAAETRPEVGELMTAIRETISQYFEAHYGDDEDEDYSLIPDDITLSAQAVQYDSLKPCFWQTIQYQCDTNI